jgi:hypothetical protein
MARGLIFSLVFVFRGGIGSFMRSWFWSVGLGVRGGFVPVSRFRFRVLFPALALFISIRCLL